MDALNQNKKRDGLERIRRIDIDTPEGVYTIHVCREDLSDLYPGMIRYTVELQANGRGVSVFRTNSYEYPPTVVLNAETASLRKAEEWEQELKSKPRDFIEYLQRKPRLRCVPAVPATDVVVIQGSPRAGGNCSILARWSLDAVEELRKTAQVLYPDDMFIRPCIGCYQCYNTGTCIYEDDMDGVIHAIKHAALIIICSPVYTNTVPGALKLLIDRCQSYNAERTLTEGVQGQKGLILSVAGRKGLENFRCITPVLDAFLRNIGITPAGEILFDGVDVLRDVRRAPGLEERVKSAIKACIGEY